MTYNRLEAKRIKGEQCRFCNDAKVPLVKTECCHQWACCDTKFISFRGGGRCQFAHEHESPCHFHFNERHQGSFLDCKDCEEFFGAEEYQLKVRSRGNVPFYPKADEPNLRPAHTMPPAKASSNSASPPQKL